MDTQRVLERRAAGLETQTTASAHDNPIGTRWVYEVLAPGQLSLTDETGRSADFQRCRDPIPATATPAEFLRGLFGIYVDGGDAYLPFTSYAGLRTFLRAGYAMTRHLLAGGYRRIAFVNGQRRNNDRVQRLVPGWRSSSCATSHGARQASRAATACISAEPITSDYKVNDVKVTAASARPATPDRTTGTVSFKNDGRPATIRFDLRRTSDGWRIDDLRAGAKPSLRAQMAPCAAGGT